MRTGAFAIILAVLGSSGVARADLDDVELHGFVSEGAFVSTANDYIGKSSRGSFELFEAGLNVSSQLDDDLRVGMQLFARNVGAFGDPPRFDWAYVDYRWRPWLGLRAGIIKMPFGIHNETLDVDHAHLPILMPQGVYPISSRDILLSHTGFAAHGSGPIGGAGELEYQAWAGTLTFPPSQLVPSAGATLDEIDTKYVAGAQVFWAPPVEGLRVGATFLRTSINIDVDLDQDLIDAYAMQGLLPADFDGNLRLAIRPATMVIGSAELYRGAWQLAAEYARTFQRVVSNAPTLLDETRTDTEAFYAQAVYRAEDRVALGGYYSVTHADAGDRFGEDEARFPKKFHAWQRDLAATVQYDVNDHWLWKLEGHFMDGAAALPRDANPDPKRFWGLVLVKTTVVF